MQRLVLPNFCKSSYNLWGAERIAEVCRQRPGVVIFVQNLQVTRTMRSTSENFTYEHTIGLVFRVFGKYAFRYNTCVRTRYVLNAFNQHSACPKGSAWHTTPDVRLSRSTQEVRGWLQACISVKGITRGPTSRSTLQGIDASTTAAVSEPFRHCDTRTRKEKQ